VSTVNNTFFASNVYLTNSSFSTLLQQPNAFLTVQTSLPNQWNLLNSYPFRDQYLSAGVQLLTTSTLNVDYLSTVFEYTSSLQVGNLRVSGNFFQDSGLTLNTNVSSLGAVTLLSSLTVLGQTFFSSHVSSLGYSRFGSTLSVGKDFYSFSSLVFQSTFVVSTSLSVVGSLSASSSFQLAGSLDVPNLLVQGSVSSFVDLGGSLFVKGAFTAFSSVTVGCNLALQSLTVENGFSTLSSMWVAEDLRIRESVQILNTTSIYGSVSVGTMLVVLGDVAIQSSFTGFSNLTIHDTLSVVSSLSTNFLLVGAGTVFGDLHVTSSPVVSTQELEIRGSLGFGDLISRSTFVGGNVSTFASFVGLNTLTFDSDVLVRGSLSTLQYISVTQDTYVLENANFRQNLALKGGVEIFENLNVLSSLTWNISSGMSTVLQGSLFVLDSVFVTDTAVLSSITLPSVAVANDFTVSTMKAGYQGIASSIVVSSLYTSSLAIGTLEYAEYTMDSTNILETWNLSSYYLSTSVLEVGPNPLITNTTFQATSSLGVGHYASTETVDVNTLAYTIEAMNVGKILSSLTINAGRAQGAFFGDGSLLRGVNYPESIQTAILSTGSLVVEKTQISVGMASSGFVTDVFTMNSTLRIGDLYVYGNPGFFADYPMSNYLFGASNAVILNNLYSFGDTAGSVQKQVVVNYTLGPPLNSNYNLLMMMINEDSKRLSHHVIMN
jgi:hypothetical protein